MWLVVFRTYKQSFLDTVITHPVSKEEPADTVRLLIVLLDNFADNRILAKYLCYLCQTLSKYRRNFSGSAYSNTEVTPI